MRKIQNSLTNSIKSTSKIKYLLFPKSGSHHTKNIYPQISKSKSIQEIKTNKRDGPCPNFKTSRREGENPARARNNSSP